MNLELLIFLSVSGVVLCRATDYRARLRLRELVIWMLCIALAGVNWWLSLYNN